MRVDVVGLDVEVTDPIRSYAEEKVAKLSRYYDAILQLTVRLRKPQHDTNHPTYEVEITADVEKHDDFIATATGDDLYLTIDGAVHKSARQLTDFKEKLKINSHHPKS